MSWTTPCLIPAASARRHTSSASSNVSATAFAIDVLARIDRLAQQPDPQIGARGVEEDRVVGIGDRSVEVGGPFLQPVRRGKARELVLVPSDQQRIGHDPPPVGQRDAAVGADLEDPPNQVLVGPHPAGHAVHRNSETFLCHRLLPRIAGESIADRPGRIKSTSLRYNSAMNEDAMNEPAPLAEIAAAGAAVRPSIARAAAIGDAPGPAPPVSRNDAR